MCHNFGTDAVTVTESGEVLFRKLRNLTLNFVTDCMG